MAEEVPPHQYLPPDSQQWGRWVTSKVQGIESANGSALTNLRSQNQSIAAQLNRLQEQIADLSVQQSYVLDDTSILSATSSGSYSYYSGGGSITVTVAQASRVRISGRAAVNGSAAVTSGVGGSVDASIGVDIDNFGTPWSKLTARNTSGLSALGGSGLSTQVQVSSTPSFSGTVVFSPGTHIITIMPSFTYVGFFGNSGNVTMTSISLSVDVLGLA